MTFNYVFEINVFGVIMIVLLIWYIVVARKSEKSNKECHKELLNMNSLLIEQNTEIRKHNAELTKANQNLNRVIVHVCSKSVRDRKDSEGENETNV